jgi:tRNA-dihydrouridine synthase
MEGSAVTVHGRTRDQYYGGFADWEIIGELSVQLNIPIIGNGDITDGASAKAMLEKTGCAGIMIGRAACGNPFLFREIIDTLSGREPKTVQPGDKIELALKHLHLMCRYKDERTAVLEMRKHLSWYLKGLRGANRLKNKVNEVQTAAEAEELLLLIRAEYVSR